MEPKKSENNKQLITFTEITLSGFHCNFVLYLERSNIFSVRLYFFFKYFFGVPHLATFIFVNFHWFVCNSQHRLHPSSIRCRGSNSRPLDHESSALTTRPWLLALFDCIYIQLFRVSFFSRIFFSSFSIKFLPNPSLAKSHFFLF